MTLLVSLPGHQAQETAPSSIPFIRESQDNEADLRKVAQAVVRARRVAVVAGAGISCAAGIPDFRSSDGLFEKLKRDNPKARLSSGKDLFSASAFQSESNISLFFSMIAELTEMSNNASPTAFHRFLKALDDEGKLFRVYTQNIDGLEEKVGLSYGLGEWVQKPTKSTSTATATGTAAAGRGKKRKRGTEDEGQPDSESVKPTGEVYVEGGGVTIPTQPTNSDEGPSYLPSPPSTQSETNLTDPEDDPASDPRPMGAGSAGVIETRDATYGGVDAELDEEGEELRELITPKTSQESSGSSTPRPEAITLTKPGTDRSPFSIETSTLPTPAPTPVKTRKALEIPKVIPLHGCLKNLHCPICNHVEPLVSHVSTLRGGNAVNCPECAGWEEAASAVAVASSSSPSASGSAMAIPINTDVVRRSRRGVGVMKPSIVLYDDPSPHSSSQIGSITHKDLMGPRPDLLIVAGTTLKVPGTKRLVRELSKVIKPPDTEDKVHIVYLGLDWLGGGKKEWQGVFDVWIKGDLQSWVEGVEREKGEVERKREERRVEKVRREERKKDRERLAVELEEAAAKNDEEGVGGEGGGTVPVENKEVTEAKKGKAKGKAKSGRPAEKAPEGEGAEMEATPASPAKKPRKTATAPSKAKAKKTPTTTTTTTTTKAKASDENDGPPPKKRARKSAGKAQSSPSSPPSPSSIDFEIKGDLAVVIPFSEKGSLKQKAGRKMKGDGDGDGDGEQEVSKEVKKVNSYYKATKGKTGGVKAGVKVGGNEGS